LVAAGFSLRFIIRRLKSAAIFTVTMILLLGTVPDKAFALNYSTATDTTDSDFNNALFKSTITIQGSGDEGYVEISTSSYASGGWLTGWAYRRTINISNAGASGLNDYQVWIATDEFSSSDWTDIISKAQDDMDDFRFTMSTATTTIPYWISPDTDTPEGFWVKVTTVPTAGTSIHMYYGNLSASIGADSSKFIKKDITAYWNFDENSGTNLPDVTGNGYNGTLQNMGDEDWVPGIIGNALDFDGDNDQVDMGMVSAFGNLGVLTVTLWVKTNSSAGTKSLVRYDAGDFGWGVIFRPSGYPEFQVKGTSHEGSGQSTTAVNNGSWHFVVGRYSGTLLEIIVDVSDNDNLPYSLGNCTSDQDLYIGSGAASEYFTGSIDEVGFWRRALTDAEIIQLYNNGDGKILYAATEPTIGSVGNETQETEYYAYGELQSRAIDTTEEGTSWGEISWGESTPAGTDIKLKTRTGDNDSPPDDWSGWYPSGDEWYKVNTGTPIGSPRARYIQYLSSFTTTISSQTPQLTEVNIQYSTNTATAPSLTNPDSSWNNSTPVFDWTFGDNESDTQTAYQLRLSTDINFSVTNFSTGPYSSVYSSMTWPSADPIDGGIYWWQCKTQDSCGKWSVWSDTYQVKVDTIAPVGMTISWIRSDDENQITIEGTGTDAGGGLNAEAWWFEETTGNSGATSSSVWESTSVYTDSGLSRNTQYTYRVKMRDAVGNVSGWSTAVNKKTQPCVWQEKTTTRTGPNAFGFEGDGVWTWKVPANGGSQVTITAYVQYNSDYGGATKPKFTLSNMGVNSSDQMSGGADTWEKLTVSGTPSGKGVLFLKVEGFSTAIDAKYFVDDIQINQP